MPTNLREHAHTSSCGSSYARRAQRCVGWTYVQIWCAGLFVMPSLDICILLRAGHKNRSHNPRNYISHSYTSHLFRNTAFKSQHFRALRSTHVARLNKSTKIPDHNPPWHIKSTAVVPKVSSVDPKGSATSSQWISGHISVIAAFKITYILIKEIMFC